MITRLHIENFKSWRDTGELRFAPLTGFFGSNSSGKTALTQFLLMLKQTVDSPDRSQVLDFGDERDLVALGTFADVVFRHERTRSLRWELDWRRERELVVKNPAVDLSFAPLVRDRRVEFAAEVTEKDSGRISVDSLLYRVGSKCFGMRRQPEETGHYELHSEGSSSFEFRRTQGRAWPLPPPVKCYGFPDQVKAYYQNAGFLSDFELAFEELFAEVFYLGPLREYPKRQYTWAGAEPADMGRRGERVIDALLASRQAGPKISRGRGRRRFTVEEYVGWWLKELGLIHDFSVTEITRDSNLYQVRVRRSAASPEVLLTDVGFGVSQILPVLVLCYYAPEASTLILEQPEIHLHPSVQAGLADVFIDAIEKRGIQILLESHSEYLLKRLQRRIAEENGFTDEDVALYFCSTRRGESRAQPLEVDSFGNIANWPQDFFGDEMEDLAARTRAAMERKKAIAG